MIKKFRIVYSLSGREESYELLASSKYNAKQRFYLFFPRAEIVKVEEVYPCDEREAD